MFHLFVLRVQIYIKNERSFFFLTNIYYSTKQSRNREGVMLTIELRELNKKQGFKSIK